MSDARGRRQETKFSDVTAIGRPAEGVVAPRGDEDDLHGAIRRYDFEFRLDKMLGHGSLHQASVSTPTSFLARQSRRTSSQALAHPDNLNCVPSAASRRGNIALIESCRGCNRGERCEFIQDRPEPLGAVRRRLQNSVSHAPPEASGLQCPTCLSKMRINRVSFLTVAFLGVCWVEDGRRGPGRVTQRPFRGPWLIAFLASETAKKAIRKSGMEPSKSP